MDTDEIFIPKAQCSSNEILSSFTDRQKNLFNHLKKAEVENCTFVQNGTPTPMDIPIQLERSAKRKRSETKSLRGKESIFKRPEEPLSKCLPPRAVPDFRRNPHKWKKYSLDHVDISDKGNTNAALSFLREMEDRKFNDEKQMEEDEARIRFNKSAVVKRQNNNETNEEKQNFRGTKIVMPEYVVGQKKNVRKVVKKVEGEKGKELKLDHLNFEDDDDDE